MNTVILNTGSMYGPPFAYYAHYRAGNGFVVTGFVADVDQAHRFSSLAEACRVADALRQLPPYQHTYVHRFSDGQVRLHKQIALLGKLTGMYA